MFFDALGDLSPLPANLAGLITIGRRRAVGIVVVDRLEGTGDESAMIRGGDRLLHLHEVGLLYAIGRAVDRDPNHMILIRCPLHRY